MAPAYSGFAYPENKTGGDQTTQSNRQKNDATFHSGSGLAINYQPSTGFRQCGCRILLVKPEAIDPRHRSMLCKDSNPFDRKVKDAYSMSFNQKGRTIDSNDSCSMTKHEFLQAIESSTVHHSLALCRRNYNKSNSSLSY